MSHIKTIEIKNFKSIRHQKIEDCRRVNVFIGYPNVGKSNILEALGLFGVLGLDLNFFRLNEICRVKSFSDLFFNRDTRDAARILINERVETELIIDKANELQTRINSINFSSSQANRQNVFSTATNNRDFNFSVLSRLPDLMGNIEMVKKYEFNKDTVINRNRPKALAMPFGDNLLDVLQTNGKLRKEIVEIFREYALKLVIETDEQFSLKFQKELADGSAVSMGYHQIADTLRRLIFYKAAIQTNSNSVLLFEEPEAHMFPPYISKFTTDIIFDEQDNQYFIATHSPFVINDFMEELKDDQLSIYAVGYNKEQGETTVTRLTDEQLTEIYQYGVDLFFNLEDYLKDAVS